MISRREFIMKSIAAAALGLDATSSFGRRSLSADEIKIGIVGLDTSHSGAFTKIINDPKNPKMQGVRVAFAHPYGSLKIASGASRIPQYIQEIKALGIQVVDKLEDLIHMSDVILLETSDGNLRLEQVLPILKAKKPVFMDKPVGAHLADVLKIYKAIEQYAVPAFSSSALRYMEGAQKVRYGNAVGRVIGAEAFSPQNTEPSHTDLYWYGVHGVEILFTMMGTGCESVKRIIEKEQDIVIGKWKDGRIGTYRGDLQGRQYYGGTAYGTDAVLPLGQFGGYQGLVEVIVQFFKDRKPPVEAQETIEIYTFMEAADISKKQNGEWVSMQKTYDAALMGGKN